METAVIKEEYLNTLISFEDAESLDLEQSQELHGVNEEYTNSLASFEGIISEEDIKPLITFEDNKLMKFDNKITEPQISLKKINAIIFDKPEETNRVKASLNIKCVFCGIKTPQRVILFNDKILKKCKMLLNIRRINGLKYSEVILPTEPNDSNGYHRFCYKPFSAVNKKYYDRMYTQTSSTLCKKIQATHTFNSFEDTESISLNQPERVSKINEVPKLIYCEDKIIPLTLGRKSPINFKNTKSKSLAQSSKNNELITSLKVKCVFCGIKTTERVILFNDKSLKKSKSLLNIRRINRLKYGGVVLPTKPNNISGYHRSCYKPFSAINKKYYHRIYTRNSSTLFKKIPKTQSSTSMGKIKYLTEQGTKTIIARELIGKERDSQDSFENIESIRLNQPKAINVCFFCNKNHKKYQREMQTLQYCSKNDFIQSYLILSNSEYVLNRLQNTNIVFYHNICVQNYYNRKKRATRETKKTCYKNHHITAYAELCDFIMENIINRKNCCFLSYLHRYYLDCLQKAVEGDFDQFDHTFTAHQLETQIRKTFEGNIKLITKHNKKIVLPQLIVAIDDKLFSALEDSETIQNTAWVLRKSILQMESIKVSDNLFTEHSVKLESSIPNQLFDFITMLIGGSDPKLREDSNYQQKVNYLSQEIIFAVRNFKSLTHDQQYCSKTFSNFKNTGYDHASHDYDETIETNEGILQDPLAIYEHEHANDIL